MGWQLCFALDSDGPAEFQRRWATFKNTCEGSKSQNSQISAKWARLCAHGAAGQLEITYADEGGLMQGEKHVRFRDQILDKYSQNDAHVLVDVSGPWTTEELEDLILRFRYVASRWLGSGALCVSAWWMRYAAEALEDNVFGRYLEELLLLKQRGSG